MNLCRHISWIVIGMISLSACKDEAPRQAAIASRVQEKVEDYRNKKLSECRRQALDIATQHADSILLHNAELWQIQGDNIPRPPRPGKPDAPKIKVKVDSSPVIPLFPIENKKILGQR